MRQRCATIFNNLGDFSSAIKDLNKVLELDTENAEAKRFKKNIQQYIQHVKEVAAQNAAIAEENARQAKFNRKARYRAIFSNDWPQQASAIASRARALDQHRFQQTVINIQVKSAQLSRSFIQPLAQQNFEMNQRTEKAFTQAREANKRDFEGRINQAKQEMERGSSAAATPSSQGMFAPSRSSSSSGYTHADVKSEIQQERAQGSSGDAKELFIIVRKP